MDNTEPNDPMWATFRERHPDVNLVLLPGDGTDEQPPPAPLSSLGEAHEASAALERKVRLIGEVLGVPHDPVPGWARTPERAYQPTVRLNGSVAADTPTDAEIIEHRLSQLGWVAKARSNEAVVLVDGHSGEDFVRVTIVDGIAGVRASGEVQHASDLNVPLVWVGTNSADPVSHFLATKARLASALLAA